MICHHSYIRKLQVFYGATMPKLRRLKNQNLQLKLTTKTVTEIVAKTITKTDSECYKTNIKTGKYYNPTKVSHKFLSD